MGNRNTLKELECMLNLIPYEITLKKLNGDYIYGNKKFFQDMNCSYDEVYGHNKAMFWSKEDCRIIEELDNEVLEKNKGIFSERKLRNFTKNERWFHMYKAPININNETYIFTLSQEITIDKKISNLMEYEIERDSQDTLGYRDILYDNENSGYVSDHEYKKRITVLCRNLSDELQAAYINIYLYDDKNNDLNLYLSTYEEEVLEKQKVKLGDNKFIKFTNNEITINHEIIYKLYENDIYELKIYEIRYGNNIIGIMCIYYDKSHTINIEQNDLIKSTCYKFGLIFQNRITSRKLKEEEKKNLEYKNALELETLKTEFFSGISHEFRTPLNIITTAIQLINSVLKTCECNIYKSTILKNLDHIKQNSNRLIRLLNNILDVNKISNGYTSMKLVNCNIIEVIEDTVMSVADYISNSGKNIIFDTDKEEIIMACDIDKIEKVILNLLSNAIKYSYKNTNILVKVHFDDEKNEIVVSVWDNGIVIDKKDDNRIFGKFVQLHKLLNRPCEGTGVGLFLVKSFIELHNGKVWVNYDISKGTEVDFSMPVRIIEGEEVVDYSVNRERKVEVCNVEFSDIYSI